VLPTILTLIRESTNASLAKEILKHFPADAEDLRHAADIDPIESAKITKDLKEIFKIAQYQLNIRPRWIHDVELCTILKDLKLTIDQINQEPNHCSYTNRYATILSSVIEGQ
jgi:hypothetical protein